MTKINLFTLYKQHHQTIHFFGIIFLLFACVILVLSFLKIHADNQKEMNEVQAANATFSVTNEDEHLESSRDNSKDSEQKLSELDSKQAETDEKEKQVDPLKNQTSQLKQELSQAQTSSKDTTSQKDPSSSCDSSKDETSPPTKTVYLTFDDGPSPNTPKILKILKENDVHATFFVIKTSYSDYMKDIVNDGNEIGLHSYTHNFSLVYKSVDSFFDDMGRINQLVEKQTGKSSKLMRFPGGSSNTISKKYSKSIMTTLSKEVVEKGYQYFDWNCDSGDASGNNIPAKTLINNVKNGVQGMSNVCILMHDSSTKSTTVEALPKIIKYLRNQNYQFGVLTPENSGFHHKIYN